MKLGLGTVQFGLDYGITNKNGRPPLQEVRSILAHAQAHGIAFLDTAALYGEAESVLGNALPRPHHFDLITKTLPLNCQLSADAAIKHVIDGIESSLGKLNEKHIYGVLVHRPEDLLGKFGKELFRALEEQKQLGRITKIGASVYTPAEAERIIDKHAIDIVQIPLNPLDQRAFLSGTLDRLKRCSVEIHVRSVFLQGLLLTPIDQQPPGPAGLNDKLVAWHRFLSVRKLSPLAASLGFLNGLGFIDAAICGTATLQEWTEITSVFADLPPLQPEEFKELAVTDDNLIDPRCWPPGR